MIDARIRSAFSGGDESYACADDEVKLIIHGSGRKIFELERLNGDVI